MLARVDATPDVKFVICGLSRSLFIDLAGSKMLDELHGGSGADPAHDGGQLIFWIARPTGCRLRHRRAENGLKPESVFCPCG